MMKAYRLLIAALTTFSVVGCCELREELDECRSARTEWLKSAEPDVAKAAALVAKADLNQPDAETAIAAAACADVDALIALHRAGFRAWDNPFIILAAGKTPYPVTVKLIQRWGGDLNAKYPDGAAVIHCAAHHGQLEVVRYLIDQRVDVNTPDRGGMTPLHWAVVGGHSDVIRLLLLNGANGSVRDGKGKTPADLCRTPEIRALFQ